MGIEPKCEKKSESFFCGSVVCKTTLQREYTHFIGTIFFLCFSADVQGRFKLRKKAAQEETPASQSKPETPPTSAPDQSESKNLDQSEAEEMPDLNDPEVQDAAIKIQVLNNLEVTLV